MVPIRGISILTQVSQVCQPLQWIAPHVDIVVSAVNAVAILCLILAILAANLRSLPSFMIHMFHRISTSSVSSSKLAGSLSKCSRIKPCNSCINLLARSSICRRPCTEWLSLKLESRTASSAMCNKFPNSDICDAAALVGQLHRAPKLGFYLMRKF